MCSRVVRNTVMAATLFALPLTTPLHAQENDQSKDGSNTLRTTKDGDTIVVTARAYVSDASFSANKTDIPLIQSPQSVSVISRDQIDLLNFIDVQQAVRYSAGVTGENYGPDLRYDFLTVRGFIPKQYIDGLVAPSTTTIASTGVDLYAFDSVEILKGPVSTLYGSTPPGGIYNQTSRRVSDEFGGEIRGKVGTDDYYELAGTLTGAIIDGISARVTGLYLNRGSERDFVDAERVLLAPTFSFDIGPETALTVNGYYQKDIINGEMNGFLPVEGTLLPNPNGKLPRSVNLGDPDNRFEREQYAVGASLKHVFSSNVSLISSIRYNDYDEETPQNVYGGGGFTNRTDPGQPDFFRTIGRFNFTYSENVEALSSDTRLDANFETGALTHKVIAGVDYRRVVNVADFGFFFDPQPIDAFDPVFTPIVTPTELYPDPFNNQRLRQTGIYAQNQIGLGNLFLTLGARQDWVNIANRADDTDTDQNAFTWRAGLNYVTKSGLAPYISYARSFEPVLGVDSVTNEPFKASRGEQYEGGIKYDGRTLGGNVDIFATAALFHIRQTNVVATAPSNIPVSGTQSGEVESSGVELEFAARINNQVALNGSYSFTDSEVTANANIPVEVGEPLPVTPRHRLALFGNYTVQQGALGGLGLGMGVRYSSKSAGSLPGPFNPVVFNGDASLLFDAIISYDTPDWRFAVNGSNIFDQRYVGRCARATGCNFGAGRQIIGTATYKF
ncbi:TonB-dependent siderophore receptor [Parasphingorhabdus cellanae]|uniref:TonB-dependent siderophore receptor n=1 Tax=Parasphingorhabdus cellanae TaxID=2806553 RepID=A0ABX7T2S8_9SPHN|nr:TonB-dependent siderophore receptor [Parasphingorhabdus cellanae]QTD55864.1 TonB-dependent siderophore receptor [Parasphingorhabdus cellanae]